MVLMAQIDGTHTVKRVHFIGIGGTAMAGAAVMAQQLGLAVSGSDQNLYSPTVDQLIRAEIPFKEAYAAANLHPAPDLVVLGNAISRGNAELEAALNLRLDILSLPEFIAGYIIGRRDSLVIAGTHGKTTTTSLVAHTLRSAGIDCGYMVGGVCESLATTAAVGSANCFVIEGDEYDTSIFDPRPKFLSYRPTHVIINNIEFDHADIFTDLAAVELAFSRLIKIIPQNGLLVTNADNESCVRLATGAKARVVTFGESGAADYRLTDFDIAERMVVRYSYAGRDFSVRTSLLGRHNALNIVAAAALLTGAGVSAEAYAAALESFRGVRRRLQIRLNTKDCTVIEDFAHHPTAIAANLETLRRLYPGRRLLVLLEPRSNTMVRSFFQQRLVAALKDADLVFIDKIYRAEKYADSDRLNLPQLKADLEKTGKAVHLLAETERARQVTERIMADDVVCFMTNGSFGGLIDETVSLLAARTK